MQLPMQGRRVQVLNASPMVWSQSLLWLFAVLLCNCDVYGLCYANFVGEMCMIMLAKDAKFVCVSSSCEQAFLQNCIFPIEVSFWRSPTIEPAAGVQQTVCGDWKNCRHWKLFQEERQWYIRIAKNVFSSQALSSMICPCVLRRKLGHYFRFLTPGSSSLLYLFYKIWKLVGTEFTLSDF